MSERLFRIIALIDIFGVGISSWVAIGGWAMNEPRIWWGGLLVVAFFLAIFAVLYYVANLPMKNREDE